MPVTEEDVAGLVEMLDDATDAYIRGDIEYYLSLFESPEEFSLMPPYGGETVTDIQRDEESIAETSRFFVSGEGTFDPQHTIVGGDLVVLVSIERQHAQVGDFPDQDWSLRVTQVFRKVGDRWHLLHRHADPLVRPIPMEHCAALARGLDE